MQLNYRFISAYLSYSNTRETTLTTHTCGIGIANLMHGRHKSLGLSLQVSSLYHHVLRPSGYLKSVRVILFGSPKIMYKYSWVPASMQWVNLYFLYQNNRCIIHDSGTCLYTYNHVCTITVSVINYHIDYQPHVNTVSCIFKHKPISLTT